MNEKVIIAQAMSKIRPDDCYSWWSDGTVTATRNIYKTDKNGYTSIMQWMLGLQSSKLRYDDETMFYKPLLTSNHPDYKGDVK